MKRTDGLDSPVEVLAMSACYALVAGAYWLLFYALGWVP